VLGPVAYSVIPGRGYLPIRQFVAHIGNELRLVLTGDFKILDGLGKLPRSRLYFLEEARIFDRDDRLVGEGLQQFNLSVGKWAHLRATQGNCPNCLASANKGDSQHGVVAKTPRDRTASVSDCTSAT